MPGQALGRDGDGKGRHTPTLPQSGSDLRKLKLSVTRQVSIGSSLSHGAVHAEAAQDKGVSM